MTQQTSTPSARAQIITRRTYCRPLNEEASTFETWDEVVDRVVIHQRRLWSNAMGIHENDFRANYPEKETELAELGQLIRDRKASVAGRTLWLGGTPIANEVSISQFNCSAIQALRIHDVVDIFWALLNGAGVGFTPVSGTLTGFRCRINEVAFIPSTRSPDDKGQEDNFETFDATTGVWTIVVGDSARAWSKSIGKLLAGKYPAKKLVIDFSQIRGAGKRLRNYGWISQGDVGLRRAYSTIVDIMNDKVDRLLSSINILDIVNLLGTVLSTRRSAQIAVMTYGESEWKDFVGAKDSIFSNDGTPTGLEHRSQSNNSIIFNQRPDKQVLHDLMWSMHRGGRGEPGLINGEGMRSRAPWAWLLNPCVVPETMILTRKGYKEIKDCVGREELWNGEQWSMCTIGKTSDDSQILKVETSVGTLECTPYHKFYVATDANGGMKEVTAETLQVGDKLIKFALPVIDGKETLEHAYTNGVFTSRGHKANGRDVITLHGARRNLVAHMTIPNASLYEEENGFTLGNCIGLRPKFFVPLGFNVKSKLEWLSGVLDGDGMAVHDRQKDMHTVQLTSWNLDYLERTKLLLQELGVAVTLLKDCTSDALSLLDDGGDRGTYRLVINEVDMKQLLALGLQLLQLSVVARTLPTITARFIEILSVTDEGRRSETFCFNEPLRHMGMFNGILTGQCAEILLSLTGGVCNLVTIDLGKFKRDTQGLHRAAKLIARANYRQSCVNFNDGILQESWNLNNDHLHLMGVSLMGVAKRLDMKPYDYASLRRTVTTAGYNMADELGLPYPKLITTMKPEGTISKCFDSTEGMHTPMAKYIINNVAFSKHDPMLEVLREANYTIFDHPYDPSAKLVSLPVMYDDVEFTNVNGKLINTESAIDQLNRYKMLMHNWCDHNVSCTISYEEHEVDEIVEWLFNNWDSYVGVSFLIRNDVTKTAKDLGYPYLPQVVVTEEEYRTYTKQLRPVDFDSAAHTREYELEADCAGGACPIR